MESLQVDVADLKSLGKTWGLSVEDVDHCIAKALSHKLDTAQPEEAATKLTTTKVCSRILLVVTILPIAVVTSVTLFNVAYNSDSLGPAMFTFLNPYVTPFQRFFRHVSLPLHPVLNLSYYHHGRECVLENPFFHQELDPGCEVCTRINKIRIIEKRPNKTIKLAHFGYPMIFKKAAPFLVNVDDLRHLVHNYSTTMHDSTMRYVTTAKWFKTSLDLDREDLHDKLEEDPTFHMLWTSFSVNAGRLLRRFFPRPYLVPSDAEVSLQKSIIIDGPEALSYELPQGGISMYMQTQGARKIVLTPPKHCIEKCIPHSIFVNESDVFTFPNDIFTARVLPDLKSLSVGVLLEIM